MISVLSTSNYSNAMHLHFFRYFSAKATGTGKDGPLWRVSWLIDTLNRRFRRYFQPGRNVAVDETLVPFKGRAPFRQYIKNKPRKWGIKLWCLADSVSGYVSCFNVYTGAKDEGPGSLSHRVVVGLLRLSGLAGYGYRIFVDSFFTSVDLFSDLFSNFGTYACGTLRIGRRGVPKIVLSNKPEGLGKERGASVCIQKGSLVATAWRDRKIVYTLSTFHGDGCGVVSRRVMDGGRFTRKEFRCPASAVDYTESMGGVDRADQYARYYLPDRKGLRWNVKLVFYLLQVSVVNSFILMKKSRLHQGTRRLSLLDFVLDLVDGLLSGRSKVGKRGRPAIQAVEQRLLNRCMPGRFDKPSWCYICSLQCRKGLQSKRAQTAFGCLECGKHLCLPECFTLYHTKANL